MCESLKIGISSFPYKEKFMVEEVAFVIEDMILELENLDKPFMKYSKDKNLNFA